MKKQDRLFELIKSLTKNEKGYFKKYSAGLSQKEEANLYVKLFDLIDRQKEYEEEPLAALFSRGRKKFNFPAAKNFLYDRVLNSLESYHSVRVSGEIRSMMNQVEILMQKMLHQQAEKLLEKAAQLAEKHEIDELMPDILLRRIILWKIRKFNGVSESELEDCLQKLHKNLHHIRLITEVYRYQFLYDSLYTTKGTIADRDDKKEFASLLASIEGSEIGSSESFPVKAGYYLLLHSMQMFADEAGKGYETNLKLLQLFEQRPLQQASRRNTYHHTLARIVESQVGLGYYEEAANNLEKLRESSLSNPGSPDYNFWLYYNTFLQIVLAQAKQDFQGLLKLIEDNNELLYPKLVNIHNTDIQLKLLAAQIYFYWQKFDKSLELLNEILNSPRNGVRTDMYCYAKLLVLITYWEMDNLSVMPYELRSLRHFFESRLALIDSDKLLLRFIEKNMQKSVNAAALIAPFKQLKEDLEASFSDRFNKRLQEYIDVIQWIESKIQRLPMTEVKSVEALRGN